MQFEIRRFASVTSTMAVAQEAAQAGAREGLVIVADEQTKGRGRRGRSWSSPPGAGLYLSIVLRPTTLAASELALLTLAAGLAVHRALVQAVGLITELKWPNDVVMKRRKLAGILAEGTGLGSSDSIVVLGIGLNVLAASHPDDVAVRATSLEAELGREIDPGQVLEAVLQNIASLCDDLRTGKADGILREWRAVAPSAEGARVEWQESDGTRCGATAGIDASGALLIRTTAGVERIVGGELVWR